MDKKFYCETCKTSFARKYLLSQHYKSKKHSLRAQTTDNQFKYCHCGKSYTSNTALKYHQRTCTNATLQIEKETEVEDEDEDVETSKTLTVDERQVYEEEIEELKQEIERLKAEKSVTNNNQNIETQNNIHIHINAFGNENIDYITDNTKLRCIKHITQSIPMLVRKIHFNPKHPENHNVKITNHRLPFVKVLNENKEWKYEDKERTVSNIITKSYTMLEITYEGYKDEIPESTQRNFEIFQNQYNENDNKTMKNLNKNVEMIMMNGP